VSSFFVFSSKGLSENLKTLYLKFAAGHVNFRLLLLTGVGVCPLFFWRMAMSGVDDRPSLKIRITELAEKTALSMSMEVVLVEIRNEGGRTILRVYIDQPGGITLEDCAQFSRRFSTVMDVEDFVSFAYVLEVSSPGVNRPLVKEADFQRFLGENARVRTRRPIEGQRNFKGRIVDVNEGRVTFESAPDKQVVIDAEDIEKSNLIADLNIRAPIGRKGNAE
jgi:ribosome maturation factor RimP